MLYLALGAFSTVIYMKLLRYLVLVIVTACSGLVYATKKCSETCLFEPTMRAEDHSFLYGFKTKCLRSFLDKILFIDPKEWKNLPYIASSVGQKNLLIKGDIIYAKGLSNTEYQEYSIVNIGQNISDPLSGKDVVLQLNKIGEASVIDRGDLTKMVINQHNTSISTGAKLLPALMPDLPENIYAKLSSSNEVGYVLSMESNKTISDLFSTIIISMGKKSDIAVGDVLKVFAHSRNFINPFSSEKTELPPKQLAEIMIFSVEKNVSIGLILNLTEPISIYDKVSVSIDNLGSGS